VSWGQWLLIGVAVAAVSAFLGYEAYALLNRIAGDTISEYIWTATRKYPIIPALLGLVVGLLFGHFFWQR
jgi:hypothetical protein